MCLQVISLQIPNTFMNCWMNWIHTEVTSSMRWKAEAWKQHKESVQQLNRTRRILFHSTLTQRNSEVLDTLYRDLFLINTWNATMARVQKHQAFQVSNMTQQILLWMKIKEGRLQLFKAIPDQMCPSDTVTLTASLTGALPTHLRTAILHLILKMSPMSPGHPLKHWLTIDLEGSWSNPRNSFLQCSLLLLHLHSDLSNYWFWVSIGLLQSSHHQLTTFLKRSKLFQLKC